MKSVLLWCFRCKRTVSEAPIALPPWRRPTAPAAWPATNLHRWSPRTPAAPRRAVEDVSGEVKVQYLSKKYVDFQTMIEKMNMPKNIA